MKRIFEAFVKRPLKNFNVENRAQNLIKNNEDKPSVAPKHPSTAKQFDAIRDNPEETEQQRQKNEELHARLKGMVVKPDKVAEISHRPLPTSVEKLIDSEYGFHEPDKTPLGKCSLKQVITFVNDYSANPDEHNAKNIADSYKLDAAVVENVLKYYQTHQVQMPRDPTKYDSPDTSQTLKELFAKSKKKLPSGNDNK